ncbi:ATP-binding cassette domain-containing protein [Brevibacillus halotolerans]|uniref:ATP-binding cassette domain-containing protein n=1 Tax=Brevibacillus halotolerans TaxID=1507437 RepID=UPI0015EEBA50|nr:ABC transporter ATP-binding protein [Brevibacillus halotolerans]
MAEVVLKQVVKSYQHQQVVKGMDLVIPEGSFTVLVGPSGCGKSTTLRMIAGLERVTKGEIWIGKQKVNDVPPGKRDLAMVFQNYALYPTMTVFDNIGFGVRNRGISKKECKRLVEEIAEIVGLQDYLHRKPAQLSGGQRQRVALARAMVKKPKVFLMDEPLSNLDAKLRNQMRVELTSLHKQLGTTFIYVTHDQVEAMTMGDQIVVMNEGEIKQVASPIKLYHEPENLFVAQFIGSPSMNICQQKDHAGLLVGFRPEKVMIKPEQGLVQHEHMPQSSGSDFSSRGRIISREILGSDVLYYVQTDSDQIVVKKEADQLLSSGADVIVSVPPEHLYLFDPATGMRKNPPHPPYQKSAIAGGLV